MTARAVLDAARAAGFAVALRGEKLHIEPTPPSELLEQIRQHKAGIIKRLAPAEPITWTGREDVRLVVEDLCDEGQRRRSRR